ncbi:MAG: thiol:disulfide interchange protein DsbA/DsbL [Marinobacter sp.]|uniref:thiol:disulfide interchange protein DsbA/DsbL n=1 Tax=Marinobacter sp. TaxID=50741 RepID=UPI001B729F3C|nr:thiol:disulfide interchange protein DsbA/DsbL [Marinobacter sp.]MBQ0747516.1 thiol:disulfide interchange protein DsbA/DsbL [Marinobacter sp.]MBQ0814120.1 thiol:disulfide interchange protein DsbA/DsbL [Marinobacter sp.]|tara:strand:+ start:7657 stop:8295 length:639 start_codon:yes stop_codon:yes gene_type:complete
MFRALRTVVLLLSVLAVFGQANAADWKEGTHYKKLDTPVRTDSGSRVEVVEVFWYGCPHCYNFKPLAESWEAKAPDYVDYVRLPAALGRSWEPHARAFYALEAINALDKLHDALFDALAGERRPLNDGESLAEFVAGYGVDREEFLDSYNSFGVNARLQQAQAKIRGARVTGTPTMLVNGKYTVSASMAGSLERVLEVVDYLVAREHNTAGE